jgi:dTDP-glucose pyrophosphorylase
MALTTQAVVLARGLGTRMQRDDGTSLSGAEDAAASSGAKGMMPVGDAGRPFLDYVLSALADAAITDVMLVVAPENDAMRHYYSRIVQPSRLTITFAEQVQPRGTADAVASVRGAVRDAPFLVLNSDNLYPAADVRSCAEIGRCGLVAYEAESLARASGFGTERVMRYALLDIAPDDTLRDIREKPAPNDPFAIAPERWVSMNLWSFTPAIFEACKRVQPSPRGELELQDAVLIAMRELGQRFTVIRRREGSVLDLSHRADVALVRERLKGVVPRL